MTKHYEFILTPIKSILEDAIIANSGVEFTIETYSLSDYILQSLLLKMTGFQEQKLKCIAWEMATYNYEYRRKLLNDDDNLGEYSSYKSKNKIYQRLISLIEKEIEVDCLDLNNILDKQLIRNKTVDLIKTIFNGTTLSIWKQKDFNYYKKNIKEIIKPNHFGNKKNNLFESSLQDLYEILYKYRNRCAHNTYSYQQNLPTLSTLSHKNYLNQNYFIWFTQLVIIDEIFISLYKYYIDEVEDIDF